MTGKATKLLIYLPVDDVNFKKGMHQG